MYPDLANCTNKEHLCACRLVMAAVAILIVNSDNATVRRLSATEEARMFDKLSEELLDLRVTERGSPAVGNAFAAFPICCSVVLCCSSSCSEAKDA